MTVELTTTNAVFASNVQAASPGSTIVESAGVWTVSHATELTVPREAYDKAGGSPSYDWLPTADLPAWQDIATLVSGYTQYHTGDTGAKFVVTEPANGSKSYLPSTGPTRAESVEDPPLAWRRRLLTFGVVD